MALPSDQAIAKALSHPVRARGARRARRPRGVAEALSGELGVDLGNMAFHTKELERLGLLKLVRTEPRRGALEHFYTARVRVRIEAETI
jgi:hypothetical protein